VTKHIHDFVVEGRARIVEAPVPFIGPRHQVEIDRNFELPTAFYAVTAALYFGFVAVMGAGFAAPGTVIPVAIAVVFIVAFFAVPTAWTRMKDNPGKPLSGAAFKTAGIMTHTGRLAPRDAAIQVLILPVLIVFWAIAAVVIAALV
jgi:hypothetical protein